MSLTFTMDDVREHCSPPTNGWLPGADSIKMADEIDNLRREVDHLQRESAENVAELAAYRTIHGAELAERDAEIDRLRAVLDKTASDLSDEIARSLKAEAAIARVRELCASYAGDDDIPRASVLIAIEGEQT